MINLKPILRYSNAVDSYSYAYLSKFEDNIGLLFFANIETFDIEKLTIDIKKFNIEILVIDASLEAYGPETARDFFLSLNFPIKRLFVMTWDRNFANSEDFLFFPSPILGSVEFFYGHAKHRKHLVSCINRICKAHRAFNLIELNKQHWKNEAYITMSNFSYHNKPHRTMPELTAEELSEFNNITASLPENLDRVDPKDFGILGVNSYPWVNCYLSIVTETHSDIKFITEKTTKALLAEEFFTVISGPGLLDDLRFLGFDVFDDMIDHSYYENIVDYRDKIKRMYTMLNPIVNREKLTEMTEKCKQRFAKNTEYIHSKKFLDKILNPIEEKLYGSQS